MKKNKNIITKASNHAPIRIIYKKPNKAPEVKILNDVFRLKKAIVEKQLVILPYQTLFLICHNKKLVPNLSQNIILDLSSIYGDLILVAIDRKARKFTSLSQEDILWYLQDLNSKSSKENIAETPRKNISVQNFFGNFERDFEKDTSSKNFETSLLNVLTNIELLLAKSYQTDYEGDADNEWNKTRYCCNWYKRGFR